MDTTRFTDLLLVFLLLALTAGLFLLPAGTLLRSLLPRGRAVPVLFLPTADDFVVPVVLAVALAAGLRAAGFLLAVVRVTPAVLEDAAFAGRTFRTPCFEDALVLERDEPATTLTLVFLVFGMPCNRSGLGRDTLTVILHSKIHQLPGHRCLSAAKCLIYN
ncbi:MAG TPA: hypothetical protein VNQ79_23080 [Blastocatellia bacterium]|nr:hypothetical protein [Blastocatellia bacterium]